MRLLAQVAKRFLVIFGLLGVTDRGLPSLRLVSQLGAIIWVAVLPVSIFLEGNPLASRLCRTLPGRLFLLALIDERFLVNSGLLGVAAWALLGLCLLSQLSAIFSVAVRPCSLSFVGDRLIGVQLCRGLAGGLRLLVQLAKRSLVIFGVLGVTDRDLPGLCVLSQ